MKKWIVEVAAFLILALNVTPLGAALPANGKEIVFEAEKEYRAGKYDDFLDSLHEQYQNAGEAGALRGVFESAKKAVLAGGKATGTFSDNALKKERDDQLLAAVEKAPELHIAQKVDTVVFHNLGSEYRDILSQFEALKYHIPEDSKFTVENKISALETEYYIKSLLLNIGNHRSGAPAEDLYKKKVILSLEKLDKMEEVAQSLKSQEWIDKVAKARRAFRSDSSYRIDYDVLKALAQGKITTENPVEENVKNVMMQYLAQSQQSASDTLRELAQK